MERRHVLIGAAAAGVAASTLGAHRPATAAPPPPDQVDTAFLATLTEHSNNQVPRELDRYASQLATGSPRGLARTLRRLAAAYSWPESDHFHDRDLVTPMRDLAQALVDRQHSDGTYDIGNLHSPPDTSFAMQDITQIWAILTEDNQARTRPIRLQLQKVMRLASSGLRAGGVHTPNHRWELCAAMARIHQLFPDQKLVDRIDQWLAEGIDIDADGMYSERSSTYASEVSNISLLAMAWALDRPELREPVRANLEATFTLLEPNGEVETIHSRRQDQKGVRDLWWYLLQLREIALVDQDGRHAQAVADILDRGTGELGDFLPDVIQRPELTALLPDATSPVSDGTSHLPGSDLIRHRAGARTSAVFGGTDYPEIPVIGSGLSTNPTFAKFRSGAAILDSIRLSPRFFSTGHFRSDGLEVLEEGRYRLFSELKVPYHLPLPVEHQREDGDYALTDEGRFWAKMDFGHRPKHTVDLTTEIIVDVLDDGLDLDIGFTGAATTWTLELAFRPGGTLTGVEATGADDQFHLVEGTGTYTVGDDVIEFGPGTGAGSISMDPGERYTYLGGSVDASGTKVYLTGATPGQFALTIRG